MSEKQSNTVLELGFTFTAPKLQESFFSFSSANNCKTLKVDLLRWLKTGKGVYKRVTAPKGGSLEIVPRSLSPEDNHGQRFLFEAIIMSTNAVAAPIQLDPQTEEVRQLPPLTRTTYVKGFLDTGAGRGCMTDYWAKDDSSGDVTHIILPIPEDMVFDDDHDLLPACMIETIDETKLKKPGQK